MMPFLLRVVLLLRFCMHTSPFDARRRVLGGRRLRHPPFGNTRRGLRWADELGGATRGAAVPRLSQAASMGTDDRRAFAWSEVMDSRGARRVHGAVGTPGCAMQPASSRRPQPYHEPYTHVRVVSSTPERPRERRAQTAHGWGMGWLLNVLTALYGKVKSKRRLPV